MRIECLGGGHDGQWTDLPPSLASIAWDRLRLPVREPCGCVGYWIYWLWGGLGLAIYYEPPALHAIQGDLGHPPRG